MIRIRNPNPKQDASPLASAQRLVRLRGHRLTTVDDLKLAPFHLLATEEVVHIDKDDLWHMGNSGASLSFLPDTMPYLKPVLGLHTKETSYRVS